MIPAGAEAGKSLRSAMGGNICYNEFMLSEFIEKKLKRARYKLLKDRSYFGEVPGIKGVWANAKNLEDCRRELGEVLEDWLLLKVRAGDKIPGFELRTDRRELVGHA
jgi:predicted RNase H-like HicB family nuclease